jgi:hypothetical protein
MTNNANQKRQPKGTENGGQFAPDVNAECTLELAAEPKVSAPPTIADHERAIAKAETEISGLYDAAFEIRREPDPDDLLTAKNEIIDHQRAIIEALNPKSAVLLDASDAVGYMGDSRSRLQRLTECAYAVDEAIDTLTQWDGGSGADPADVLAHLIEVRDEIFSSANPELVEQWRGLESNIRGFESDPDSSPLDDEEYEVERDEREAVFRKIYEEAFAL